MTLSSGQARRLAKQILGYAKLDDVGVSITNDTGGYTRFAVNQPTTAGDTENTSIAVRATVDGRSATVTGNRTGRAALEALVRQAEELARIAPANPEHMPPLRRQKYARVRGSDRATAKLTARQRADAVGKVIEVARARTLECSGLISHRNRAHALANKTGAFAFHASTMVSLSTTFRTPDGTGSGKTGYVSHRFKGLDAKRVAEDAAGRAERSKNPIALDPGRYTVVLEPQAVADLIDFLTRNFDARRADEGRSFFSKSGGGNKIGEKLFHDSVTLWSDPGDRKHPSSPFTREGIPRRKTTWIEKGVLKALSYPRYWAKKQDKPVLAGPSSLFVAGGGKSLDELIKGVRRGILVSRFWYNRMVEPRTILATGITRDGTFLIVDGKITRPIKSLRYNESPVTMLKNVVALGIPERAGLSRRVRVVPPIVVDGFNFESVSDAI